MVWLNLIGMKKLYRVEYYFNSMLLASGLLFCGIIAFACAREPIKPNIDELTVPVHIDDDHIIPTRTRTSGRFLGKPVLVQIISLRMYL